MKSRGYTILLALLTIGMGIWGYYQLPDTVPVHWNWRGEADNYGSKLTVSIGMPLMAFGLYLLRFIMPKLDPRQENYAKFRGSYDVMINAILTFFVVMHGIILAAGMGYDVPMNMVMPLLVGALFLVLGNYMQRVKSNYFIGIRTPWALQNEEVWRYTHRLGARMFMLAGAILIAAAFVPASWQVMLFAIAVGGAVIVPYAGSYLYFKKLSR